jgi:hypothetical protein
MRVSYLRCLPAMRQSAAVMVRARQRQRPCRHDRLPPRYQTDTFFHADPFDNAATPTPAPPTPFSRFDAASALLCHHRQHYFPVSARICRMGTFPAKTALHYSEMLFCAIPTQQIPQC